MGTDTTRLNSGIQVYTENYSEIGPLIYRKVTFWYDVREMIQQSIYLFEKAQSLAIAR